MTSTPSGISSSKVSALGSRLTSIPLKSISVKLPKRSRTEVATTSPERRQEALPGRAAQPLGELRLESRHPRVVCASRHASGVCEDGVHDALAVPEALHLPMFLVGVSFEKQAVEELVANTDKFDFVKNAKSLSTKSLLLLGG